MAESYKTKSKIPCACFYGLISDELPDLKILVNRPAASPKAALEEAVEKAIIPLAVSKNIDSLVKAFNQIAVKDKVSKLYTTDHISPQVWISSKKSLLC